VAGPGNPLGYGEEDGDEEIIVKDGDMDDEDETVGVWKITFDTGDIEEGGEFFALQGATMFFKLHSSPIGSSIRRFTAITSRSGRSSRRSIRPSSRA